MKKRVAKLLVALGMLATASASVGCVWWSLDEPKALKGMVFSARCRYARTNLSGLAEKKPGGSRYVGQLF